MVIDFMVYRQSTLIICTLGLPIKINKVLPFSSLPSCVWMRGLTE